MKYVGIEERGTSRLQKRQLLNLKLNNGNMHKITVESWAIKNSQWKSDFWRRSNFSQFYCSFERYSYRVFAYLLRLSADTHISLFVFFLLLFNEMGLSIIAAAKPGV